MRRAFASLAIAACASKPPLKPPDEQRDATRAATAPVAPPPTATATVTAGPADEPAPVTPIAPVAPVAPAGPAPSPPAPVPGGPPVATAAMAWTLTVAPATVTMARRGAVEITIAVTNRGAGAASPDRDPLEFTVDGDRSMALDLAFGNGSRGPEWTTLAAGATARDSRRGVEVATAPGDHVIVMAHAGRELARATLHVRR